MTTSTTMNRSVLSVEGGAKTLLNTSEIVTYFGWALRGHFCSCWFMDIELSPIIDLCGLAAWLLGHTGGAQRFGISRSHRVSRKRDASEEIGDRQLGFDFEQLTRDGACAIFLTELDERDNEHA
jgi:hypothetical protein